MRLFTALWPTSAVIRDLCGVLDQVPEERWNEMSRGVRRFRLIPSDRWHLTLCFHGDSADQRQLSDRLDRGIHELLRTHPEPPRLALSGAGAFRGTLWIGVRSESDAGAATARSLAGVAGADPAAFHAHITVGRWSAGRLKRAALPETLTEYVGPSWTVREVTLMRSVQDSAGPVYTAVHRVPLTRPSAANGVYHQP